MNGGGTLLMVAALLGGAPAEGTTAKLAVAAEGAGATVVRGPAAIRALERAYGDDPGGEHRTEEVRRTLQQWRLAIDAGREQYFDQRFERGAEGLGEALTGDLGAPWDVANRVRPEFAREWVDASLTWARALQALRRPAEAAEVVEALARRLPDVEASAAQFPAHVVVALADAQRSVQTRTGALDIDVQDPQGARCSIHLDGVLRGFHPLRLDRAATGSREVTAVCPTRDGQGHVRSRPIRVDVQPGRTSLRIVVGGERAVTTTAHGAAVSAAPGWSGRDGLTLRAARAAALRVGARAALVVGLDSARDPTTVWVRWVGARAGAGDAVDATQVGRRLQALPGSPFWAPETAAEEPRAGWPWWVTGGLLGAGVSAGVLAWHAHQELADCQDAPSCAGTGRVDELARDVRRRSLVADGLVVMGLLAGAAAALSSPPKTNP